MIVLLAFRVSTKDHWRVIYVPMIRVRWAMRSNGLCVSRVDIRVCLWVQGRYLVHMGCWWDMVCTAGVTRCMRVPYGVFEGTWCVCDVYAVLLCLCRFVVVISTFSLDPSDLLDPALPSDPRFLLYTRFYIGITRGLQVDDNWTHCVSPIWGIWVHIRVIRVIRVILDHRSRGPSLHIPM